MASSSESSSSVGDQLRREVPKHVIRVMKDDDISQVLEIWRLIGLHEGTQTIQSFMKVDPEGFAVAVNEETGEILGMCAGVFVDPGTAFIGLYAVRPELQGKGIGIKIWNRIMTHINGKNAGLYAVPEHLHTYRDRAGFRVEDSIRMIVYEGDGPSSTEDLVHEVGNVGISEASEDLLYQIVSYDTKITHVDRSHLLRHTIREKDTISLVAFETDQQRVGSAKGHFDTTSSRVLGYICMRTNNIGKAMVGPLYADNDAIAELLMNEALKRLPIPSSRGLLFMTLDCNPGGTRIAEKLRLECNEHLPRFFTQKLAEADFNHIYCIHTPNFSPY